MRHQNEPNHFRTTRFQLSEGFRADISPDNELAVHIAVSDAEAVERSICELTKHIGDLDLMELAKKRLYETMDNILLIDAIKQQEIK